MDIVEGGRTALDNKTSLLNTPSPRAFAGPRTREFAPYGYGDTIGGYDKSALKEAVFDDDVEQFRDCEFAFCLLSIFCSAHLVRSIPLHMIIAVCVKSRKKNFYRA